MYAGLRSWTGLESEGRRDELTRRRSIGIAWGYQKVEEPKKKPPAPPKPAGSSALLAAVGAADKRRRSVRPSRAHFRSLGDSQENIAVNLSSLASNIAGHPADLLLFTERLQIIKDGKLSGVVTISAEGKQKGTGDEHEMYQCHVSAPDYSVLSLVSADNLQTLSELRSGHGPCSTFIAQDSLSGNGFHVTVRNGPDCEPDKWHLKQDVCPLLLGEGASILLNRYLGLTRFRSRLVLLVLLDGSQGLAQMTLTATKGRTQDMTIITKKIQPLRRELPTLTIECEVTRAGEIIWMRWTPGKWHLRADPRTPKCSTMRLERALPPLVNRWRDDIQLQSMLDDLVREKRASSIRYLLDQPQGTPRDLRALMSDFMCAALLAKPLNVIAFAVDYFTAMAGVEPDEEEWDQFDDALFSLEMETRRTELHVAKKEPSVSVIELTINQSSESSEEDEKTKEEEGEEEESEEQQEEEEEKAQEEEKPQEDACTKVTDVDRFSATSEGSEISKMEGPFENIVAFLQEDASLNQLLEEEFEYRNVRVTSFEDAGFDMLLPPDSPCTDSARPKNLPSVSHECDYSGVPIYPPIRAGYLPPYAPEKDGIVYHDVLYGDEIEEQQ